MFLIGNNGKRSTMGKQGVMGSPLDSAISDCLNFWTKHMVK
jgi:hypothetical protein